MSRVDKNSQHDSLVLVTDKLLGQKQNSIRRYVRARLIPGNRVYRLSAPRG